MTPFMSQFVQRIADILDNNSLDILDYCPTSMSADFAGAVCEWEMNTTYDDTPCYCSACRMPPCSSCEPSDEWDCSLEDYLEYHFGSANNEMKRADEVLDEVKDPSPRIIQDVVAKVPQEIHWASRVTNSGHRFTQMVR